MPALRDFTPKNMAEKNEQFDRFTDTMRKFVRVPRSEIKAQLDVEKEAKKRKTH